MIVVDASALMEVLLHTPTAPALHERLFAPGETLHAPHLLDVEVMQVLRRYRAAGQLHRRRAREALQDLSAFPIERYAHRELISRMWELRRNATAYDAAYLALAEALGAPLLTRDAALARVPGLRVGVELV